MTDTAEKIFRLSGEEPKLYSSEIATWVTAPDKENYRVSYDIEGLRAENLANALINIAVKY